MAYIFRYYADIRTLVFTALYFVVMLYNWKHAASYDSAIYTFLMVCLTAQLSFMAAVAVHNTIHCPVFYNQTLNSIFQIVLSLAYGHPVSSYVPGHNLSHHKYMQQPKDVMRTTKMRYDWHFLNFILFPVKIGLDMVKNDETYFAFQKKEKRPIYYQMVLEKTILYSLAALFLYADYKKWIVWILLPHIYAKAAIITLNLLQHDGTDSNSKFNHSRNFTGKFLNFICYNNGYHTIHHWYPGKHWSTLPQEHDAFVKPNMHPNLAHKSILKYIFQAYVYPGIRQDYLGNPMPVPEAVKDEPWAYDMFETYSSKAYLWKEASGETTEADMANPANYKKSSPKSE